jgi:hypothetical protein
MTISTDLNTSKLAKLLGGLAGIAIFSLVGLIVFRIFFVDFVDNYELGYKFDSRDGRITILHESGYYVTPPVVVKIHTIDMRPMQVCINANQRVLNCKLVQFDTQGVELFLSWHGRYNYSNGSAGNSTNLNDILKSYAYDGSGKHYPFLKVIRELKPEEAATPSK